MNDDSDVLVLFNLSGGQQRGRIYVDKTISSNMRLAMQRVWKKTASILRQLALHEKTHSCMSLNHRLYI